MVELGRLRQNGENGGIDVGPSIVQRIIHRRSGRIWADAEVENGAVFYFGGCGSDGEERLGCGLSIVLVLAICLMSQ